MNHDGYRIMRDGNGTHWIEEEVTTAILRRKVWKPMCDSPYDGGIWYARRDFATKEAACTWLRTHVAKVEAARVHEENAKLRIPAGPC